MMHLPCRFSCYPSGGYLTTRQIRTSSLSVSGIHFKVAYHPLSGLHDPGERPMYCPRRGRNRLHVRNRALPPRSVSLLQIVMYPGSNTSLFFMSVQAMTSILAASLTRIFVTIPLSRCLPVSVFARYCMKHLLRVDAIRAA